MLILILVTCYIPVSILSIIRTNCNLWCFSTDFVYDFINAGWSFNGDLDVSSHDFSSWWLELLEYFYISKHVFSSTRIGQCQKRFDFKVERHKMAEITGS